MDNPDLAHVVIQVSSTGATAEEIDRDTRQLLSVLKRETDVQSAELARGGTPPPGAKGDPVTLGSIVVQVLPAMLPAVFGVVQAWAARSETRTIIYEADGLKFKGSAKEFHRLLETLEKNEEKSRKKK
jgi:hypothetical protein